MKDFNEDYSSQSYADGTQADNALNLALVESQAPVSAVDKGVIAQAYQDIPDQDDRYPGSFFRIPGRPVLGKATWSLN